MRVPLFTKSNEKSKWRDEKIVTCAKNHRHACEICGSDCLKGTHSLVREEILPYYADAHVWVKSHRLCEACTNKVLEERINPPIQLKQEVLVDGKSVDINHLLTILVGYVEGSQSPYICVQPNSQEISNYRKGLPFQVACYSEVFPVSPEWGKLTRTIEECQEILATNADKMHKAMAALSKLEEKIFKKV